MKSVKHIEDLNFRALDSKRYRITIVLAILIPASIFMAIVVYNDITNLGRGQIISIMGVAGFAFFFLVAFVFSKCLAKKYRIVFYSNIVIVQCEGKEIALELSKILSFEVWNLSDYAKLVIRYENLSIKYHVGFANLLNAKPILEPVDKLDLVFTSEKGFVKRIENIKGVVKISYCIK